MYFKSVELPVGWYNIREDQEFQIIVSNSPELLSSLEKEQIKINAIQFQKMIFLYNTLEDGWSIKKSKDSYIFSKKHEGKKEILQEDYLLRFMKTNIDFSKYIS